ncbi:DNA replication regulator SLD3-domain-containing protein [Tricladium varicosporioides]|nr:DNA replication regulator SLD3-domain-containing protein [Hymenoscyphus varicosporioides]
MLHQDEVLFSDASAKFTRSDILTPASDKSPNLTDGATSGSRKRKRDGNTAEDLLRDSFTVKPYPSTVSVKPRSLQPLFLLPRSSLPLASLDLTPTTNALPRSRLFEAHIKILELEERMGSQPMVLIARLDDGLTLYAIEREDRGLHVFCRLGSWVNLKQLKAAAVVARQETSSNLGKGFGLNSFEDPVAASSSTTSETGTFSKTKRLAIEAIQSMVKRPTTATPTESQPPNLVPEPLAETQASTLPLEPPPLTEEASSPPTAAEIFENVRTQYFEALYISKASLAYFAKGPLSRARAAFHLDHDAALDMNDHVTFLESLVLPTALLDKKYREGVPGCVALFDIHGNSDDEGNGVVPKTKKRKSSKKVKPGKNGLYSTEDALIRRWWASHDDEAESGAPGGSREELAKSRIAQLRIRETQLQLVIILEVLALQPTSHPEEPTDSLPGGLPSANPSSEKGKPSKSKKPDHLTLLIDVHIDRLCIWQSIQLEAVKAPLGDAKPSIEVPDALITNPSRSADTLLRDFCVEIIAPFFSSRLPERCAAINRKLGGPVVMSPPKPKLSKSKSFSGAPARPGAATKRPVPAKPRRSLQRVLSDERERRSVSRGPERAISLMRSATMPMVPGLKREASEVPSLSGIPDSQSLEANRGGVLNSKRFSRREVDLSALAPIPDKDTKAQKKAKIDAELKEAISALKKPNRELAGKALAETAEKRSVSASRPRKPKNPTRNPLFQAGVQITATPKASRTNDIFARFKPPELPGHSEEPSPDLIPRSSAPRIPQSVQREPTSASLRNPFLDSVQATPTRRSSSASQLLGRAMGEGGCLPSSPLHVRKSSAQLFATGSVPDSARKIPSTPRTIRNITETPVKKRPEPSLVHGHPEPGHDGNKENVGELEQGSKYIEPSRDTDRSAQQEVDIYKSLGWDDGDDIDELS